MKDVDLQLLPAEIRELLLLSGEVLYLKSGQKPKLFITDNEQSYMELKSEKEHPAERKTVMVFCLIYQF